MTSITDSPARAAEFERAPNDRAVSGAGAPAQQADSAAKQVLGEYPLAALALAAGVGAALGWLVKRVIAR